jgi:hypothetical protein
MLLTTVTRILGVVLVAQAAPLSVSELLADLDRFNGQPVTVTGTMSNFRGNPLRRGGPVYTFDLGWYGDGSRDYVHEAAVSIRGRNGRGYIPKDEAAGQSELLLRGNYGPERDVPPHSHTISK